MVQSKEKSRKLLQIHTVSKDRKEWHDTSKAFRDDYVSSLYDLQIDVRKTGTQRCVAKHLAQRPDRVRKSRYESLQVIV